jgi:hypothetical protein
MMKDSLTTVGELTSFQGAHGKCIFKNVAVLPVEKKFTCCNFNSRLFFTGYYQNAPKKLFQNEEFLCYTQ